MTSEFWSSASLQLHEATGSDWLVLRRLWQLFRYDLADITDAFPCGDGRYQAQVLEGTPSPDLAAYIVWRAHPKTNEQAPVAFTLVDGLTAERRSIAGFWVLPQLRRQGVGRQLALETIRRHRGQWLIGFQHNNTSAAHFWRAVADDAFGHQQWTETRSPIPRRPDEPADHLIVHAP